MSDNPLKTILHPRSVVVAGASNNFMKMGSIQALNLLSCGFAGEVIFIHPSESEVLGRPAYKSAADLPFVPDLALLVTPTAVTPGLIDDLGARGVRHAVIVTAGFREMGPEGAAMEARLVEAAHRHGMRFVGPNCIGIINAYLPLNLTVMAYPQKAGGLSLISQSGTYVGQTMSYLRERGIRYSKAISVGNATDIDVVDCLDYLGGDPETKAIAIYTEGIRRGREFARVARRVAAVKPIVALYVGGTATGARSGLSHTGSLGGPDALYDGIFEEAGVIRATNVAELFGWGHALATQPVPTGNRVVVLTHSGGPATSMADAIDREGLVMPELSDSLQDRIRPYIESTASSKNPIDLTFSMAHDAFTEKIPEVVFSSDETDGVLIHGIMDTGFMTEMYETLRGRIELTREQFLDAVRFDLSTLTALPAKTGKPLLASTFIRDDHAAQALRDAGIPLFSHPEAAVRAMAALVRYGTIRRRLDGAADAEAIADAEAAPGKPLPPGVMDEYAAKRLLAECGVPVAEERRVETFDECRQAAAAVGYPVVLKGLPEGVAHKSEAGLVHLGIAGDDALRTAWDAIEAAAPGCARLVARQVRGDRELVVGMTRFPGFGPCVMLGIGGVYTEAIADATFRLAGVTRVDALAMPDSLRLAALFDAQRGRPAIDRERLADVIGAVGRLALAHPEVAEIDLNPLIVDDAGTPVCVDALIVVQSPA